MGQIYRTNNPLEYYDVDGVVIDENAPAAAVRASGTGTAVMAGLFGWGPEGILTTIGKGDLYRTFMKTSHSGIKALLNKTFSTLNVIRVPATGAAAAVKTFADITPETAITFTAKYKGAIGNSISITIEDGSDSGKKYTVSFSDSDNAELFPTEIYDNVAITGLVAAMENSKLVVPTVGSGLEAVNAAITALATGSDGTVADTDYQDAIEVAEQENAGNVLFLDVYNAVRNGYLKTHAATVPDKMVICAGGENDTPAETLADAALVRDTDGRIVYAANWIKSVINGSSEFTSPASWLASLFSMLGPHVSLASVDAVAWMYGATGVKQPLTRANYISFNKGGVCAFEYDREIGIKPRSAVVTQIANSNKVTISRRRMADFLTDSLGRYSKLYDNSINSQGNRIAIKSAYLNFIEQSLEKEGILPKDSEVQGGSAKIVDIDSLNTDETIAEGKNIILYRQRIWSHMRYIVLKAEIGESVVVTEV